MKQAILVRLLHWANSSPPCNRMQFYVLKTRLLNRYGRFVGHEIQEIKKECWGRYETPCGPKCHKCGGTGVFDIRWVRLERWEWRGFCFHTPAGDTRKPCLRVDIHGRIEHKDYGRLSNEAVLWLYLLCGEWKLLARALRESYCCGRYWWPFLNLQRIWMNVSIKTSRHKCYQCDQRFFTFGSGWLVCGKCRNLPAERLDEPPF